MGQTKPSYLNWLKKEPDIVTIEGKKVEIYELDFQDDDAILSEWALHFRRQYCSDFDLKKLTKKMHKSQEEVLSSVKLPRQCDPTGPATRSGDFAELLIADYLEFILNYFVPRTRFDKRINPSIPTPGSDVVGIKCGILASISDELIIFEVKCTASEVKTPDKARLQDAIDGSINDIVRLGDTLTAMYLRYIHDFSFVNSSRIARYLNPADNPYKIIYAAAAVQSTTNFDPALIKQVITIDHPSSDLKLLVIRCDKLMKIINDMYSRASKC